MLKQYFGDKEAFGYTVGGYHVLQMTVHPGREYAQNNNGRDHADLLECIASWRK
jgi:hypothetical protein